MSQSFSIANFNLRNLVPASSEDMNHYFYSPGKFNRYSESAFSQKASWIANQLDQLDADIVAFEEVFDHDALSTCLKASERMAQAKILMPLQSAPTSSDYRGKPCKIYPTPHTAIAYNPQFEVRESKAHEDFPSRFDFEQRVTTSAGQNWALRLDNQGQAFSRFSRPVIQAQFALPPALQKPEFKTFTLFVAHLKSKRPIADAAGESSLLQMVTDDAVGKARSLVVRAIEAAALRTMIAQYMDENPNEPVLLLGDFNDGPFSVTTEISGGVNVPKVHASHEPDYETRKKKRREMGDLQLYSAFEMQTQRTHRDIYYTHIYDGHYDLLDNVFVSNHFVMPYDRNEDGGYNRAVAKIGTLRVFNDHVINAAIDDLHASKVGAYLHTRSDHGQISVRLDML